MPHNLISPLLRYHTRYTINPLSCRLLESFVRGTVERTLGQTVGEALGCQTEEMNFDSLSASHPSIALGMLKPSSDRLDLVKHARDSTTISKAANSEKIRMVGAAGAAGAAGTVGGAKVEARVGVDASEKGDGDGGTGSGACDEGGEDTSTKRSHSLSADHDRDWFIDALGASPEAEDVGWKRSGCSTKADRYNRFNDWLEALSQAEKPIDIPSNGVSPSTPAVEDVLAHLAMDSIEYQELRIATVLGDLGVQFVSVSNAQMDELFSANPSAIMTSTEDKKVDPKLSCPSLLRFYQKNSEWRRTDNTSKLRSH
ncbi:hypothetical protein I308_100126 [Cryptococcus tetragattii IND107]|uniref:Uncharacterized protein n=1 Tax=Cryptococcus tetragattii IND107 TaxID=1296105 RepID=A0ABR3C3X3_9TREE